MGEGRSWVGATQPTTRARRRPAANTHVRHPHRLCRCCWRTQVDGSPPPRAGTADYFNYNDTYGHGSHTAGIIGAVGNNLRGVAGVNWAVKLLVCRFIWNDGSGYVSDAMNCIKLCKQEGALITSNSWGGIGYSSESVGTQGAGAGKACV